MAKAESQPGLFSYFVLKISTNLRLMSLINWSLIKKKVYPSLHDRFAKAKKKFRLSLENHNNFVLSSLFLITAVVEEDEEESL